MTGILLVDDHPAVVDGLRTGLARLAGVAVRAVASSMTEARSVLSREGAFDLALVDVRLGDGSGFEVLGLVDPDRTATVLMSGYPSRAYLEGALHLGARGLLGKHRPLGQLVAAIGEVAAGGVAWDGAALRDRRERPWRPLTGRGVPRRGGPGAGPGAPAARRAGRGGPGSTTGASVVGRTREPAGHDGCGRS